MLGGLFWGGLSAVENFNYCGRSGVILIAAPVSSIGMCLIVVKHDFSLYFVKAFITFSSKEHYKVSLGWAHI